MPDFPNVPVLPLFLHTRSRWCDVLMVSRILNAAFTESTNAWPAVNRILYMPFSLPWTYPVARFWRVNGSAAGGNWRAGIYAFAEDTLVKVGTDTGAVGGSGASNTIQFAAPTGGTFLVGPGRYYLALNSDSVTINQLIGTITPTAIALRQGGMLEETPGSAALPAAATPVAVSSAYLPMTGFTRTASGW